MKNYRTKDVNLAFYLAFNLHDAVTRVGYPNGPVIRHQDMREYLDIFCMAEQLFVDHFIAGET